MINIRKGILLEKSKVLLPWGACRDSVWNIGNARSVRPFDPTDRSRIAWDEVIFDGLQCGISAYMPEETSTLEMVHVSIGPGDVFFTYLKVFKHLVQKIGPPRTVRWEPFTYGPVLTWKHQGCKIAVSCFEKHGDAFEMTIWKTRWINLTRRCS